MGTGSKKEKSFADKVKDFFRGSVLSDTSIENFLLINESKRKMKELDKSLDRMDDALSELEEATKEANANDEVDKWFREELRVLKFRYIMKKGKINK